MAGADAMLIEGKGQLAHGMCDEDEPSSRVQAPRCNGRDSGCSNIAEGDGDCDRHSDCQPGLRCGKDNCVGAQFDATDDCCFAPQTRK